MASSAAAVGFGSSSGSLPVSRGAGLSLVDADVLHHVNSPRLLPTTTISTPSTDKLPAVLDALHPRVDAPNRKLTASPPTHLPSPRLPALALVVSTDLNAPRSPSRHRTASTSRQARSPTAPPALWSPRLLNAAAAMGHPDDVPVGPSSSSTTTPGHTRRRSLRIVPTTSASRSHSRAPPVPHPRSRTPSAWRRASASSTSTTASTASSSSHGGAAARAGAAAASTLTAAIRANRMLAADDDDGAPFSHHAALASISARQPLPFVSLIPPAAINTDAFVPPPPSRTVRRRDPSRRGSTHASRPPPPSRARSVRRTPTVSSSVVVVAPAAPWPAADLWRHLVVQARRAQADVPQWVDAVLVQPSRAALQRVAALAAGQVATAAQRILDQDERVPGLIASIRREVRARRDARTAFRRRADSSVAPTVPRRRVRARSRAPGTTSASSRGTSTRTTSVSNTAPASTVGDNDLDQVDDDVPPLRAAGRMARRIVAALADRATVRWRALPSTVANGPFEALAAALADAMAIDDPPPLAVPAVVVEPVVRPDRRAQESGTPPVASAAEGGDDARRILPVPPAGDGYMTVDESEDDSAFVPAVVVVAASDAGRAHEAGSPAGSRPASLAGSRAGSPAPPPPSPLPTLTPPPAAPRARTLSNTSTASAAAPVRRAGSPTPSSQEQPAPPTHLAPPQVPRARTLSNTSSTGATVGGAHAPAMANPDPDAMSDLAVEDEHGTTHPTPERRTSLTPAPGPLAMMGAVRDAPMAMDPAAVHRWLAGVAAPPAAVVSAVTPVPTGRGSRATGAGRPARRTMMPTIAEDADTASASDTDTDSDASSSGSTTTHSPTTKSTTTTTATTTAWAADLAALVDAARAALQDARRAQDAELAAHFALGLRLGRCERLVAELAAAADAADAALARVGGWRDRFAALVDEIPGPREASGEGDGDEEGEGEGESEVEDGEEGDEDG
ncbi:hypothetical protein GGF32_002300 [Allomyces javanicus]|nr:hypothetical protein GGF32_002300 [Allomyces javanicus]